MLLRPLLAAALLLSTACSGTITTGDGSDGPEDHDAPLLTVETPERGSLVEGDTIRVSGTVTDEHSGVASVRVNDVEAEIEGDRFEAEVPLGAGITLLRTVAVDAAGGESSDLRAAMGGTFAPVGTQIENAATLSIDRTSLGVVAQILSSVAENTDFGEVAQPLNPVVNVGSECLGATVDIVSVSKSGVDVSLAPTTGGIDFVLEARDLSVALEADYSLLCNDGVADATLSATTLRAEGTLLLDVVSGDLDVDLESLQGTLEGLSVSSNTLPVEIQDLIEDDPDQGILDALLAAVEEILPPIVEDFLGDTIDRGYTTTIMDRDIEVHLVPREVELGPDGGWIAADGRMHLADMNGDFLLSPKSIPAGDATTEGLHVHVADDLVNELLASVWAGGMFTFDIALEEGNQVKGVLGDNIDRTEIDIRLPPLVDFDAADGLAHLTVGDIIIRFVDDDELGTVAAFAVTGELDLSLALNEGVPVLSAHDPVVSGKVLEAHPSLVVPVNDEMIDSFGPRVVDSLTDNINQILTGVPLPLPPDLTDLETEVRASDGYLKLSGNLAP